MSVFGGMSSAFAGYVGTTPVTIMDCATSSIRLDASAYDYDTQDSPIATFDKNYKNFHVYLDVSTQPSEKCVVDGWYSKVTGTIKLQNANANADYLKFTVGEKVFGRVDPGKVKEIIAEFRESIAPDGVKTA